jgi:hypothetical protein
MMQCINEVIMPRGRITSLVRSNGERFEFVMLKAENSSFSTVLTDGHTPIMLVQQEVLTNDCTPRKCTAPSDHYVAKIYCDITDELLYHIQQGERGFLPELWAYLTGTVSLNRCEGGICTGQTNRCNQARFQNDFNRRPRCINVVFYPSTNPESIPWDLAKCQELLDALLTLWPSPVKKITLK